MNERSVFAPLPEVIKGRCLPLSHFPSRMQALIFRCWETVPADKIAEVLKIKKEILEKLAEQMGLKPQEDVSLWKDKGYITIIKQIWHLLPYDQMQEILGWDQDKLSYILKEEDFLSEKLGPKPDCQPVIYEELTEDQLHHTRMIKIAMDKYINCHSDNGRRQPFDFFGSEKVKITSEKSCIGDGITLTGEWHIEDNYGSSYTGDYIELFSGRIFEDWHIKIGGCDAVSGKIILERISEQENRSDEYHEICIEKNRIVVSAFRPEGILRGLMYLADKARENGGPWLKPGVCRRKPVFETRYLYSYCGLYGTAFDVDPLISYPESLLREYAILGINGIWLQGILYRMTEFPFEPAMSEGWEKRIDNLKKLVKYAGKYGIKVFLYLNEPRSMPLSFYDRHPELKGHTVRGFACMCTSVPEVRNYLKKAIQYICREVPELGGFFTITRSENLTNCYSHTDKKTQTCPRCGAREPYEVISEVNNIIKKAIDNTAPGMRLFAWMWAEEKYFDSEEREKYFKALDPEIIIMSTSESDMETFIGGVKGRVMDYTMSNPGPGEKSLEIWKTAEKYGHAASAKVQINNTWECSTVPYLPVFRLVSEHIQKLMSAGVKNLMLSWTLGGYPSPNIKIASAYFFNNDESSPNGSFDRELSQLYGEHSGEVMRASELFSRGFSNFPFSCQTVYTGPQNGGPSNLLFDKPSGFSATMTCYAYDDTDQWRSIYPADVFENQFRLICDNWKEGLGILEKIPDCKFKDISFAGGSLFFSSYNQIRFYRMRDEYIKTGDEDTLSKMKEIIGDELDLASKVYAVMLRTPEIGYEAANHYYFNRSMLAEKVINCQYLLDKYYRQITDIN